MFVIAKLLVLLAAFAVTQASPGAAPPRPATAPATAPADLSGYWRHDWKNEQTGEWEAIGVVAITADAAGKPRYAAVGSTYVRPNTLAPVQTLGTTWDGSQLRVELDFGKAAGADGKPVNRVGRYTLKRDEAGLSGDFDGKMGNATVKGKTRFVRLAGLKEIVAQLKSAMSLAEIEVAALRGSIPALRQELARLDREVKDAQRRGVRTGGSPIEISRTGAEISLRAEETRLMTLEGKLLELIELVARAEIEVEPAK